MKSSRQHFFALILGLSALAFSAEGELFNQGLKAESDQNWDKAVEYFQNSLEKEGVNSETLNHLGFNLSKSSENKVNQAYMHLIKAYKLDPKNEVTLENLSTIYINQGKISKAIEMYQELTKLKSTEAEVVLERLKPIVQQAKAARGLE